MTNKINYSLELHKKLRAKAHYSYQPDVWHQEIDAVLDEIERLTKWNNIYLGELPDNLRPVLIDCGYVYPKIAFYDNQVKQWSTTDGLYFHGESLKLVRSWLELPRPKYQYLHCNTCRGSGGVEIGDENGSHIEPCPDCENLI
jgi:hypothetical protein